MNALVLCSMDDLNMDIFRVTFIMFGFLSFVHKWVAPALGLGSAEKAMEATAAP